jgi:hypothetical protein
MRNLLFSLVILFSTNTFAIPDTYNSDVKQFIFNNLKDPNYKQRILDKMRNIESYFLKKGNNYASNKIKLTIYYIEMFDIEHMSKNEEEITLFFIKNV